MIIRLANIIVFLCVMARVTGLFLFNPILGRRNVPALVKMALSLVLALYITNNSAIPYGQVEDLQPLQFVLLFLKEFAIGFVTGFVIEMFLAALNVGGEVLDMQMGLSMAKGFDPTTNLSLSLTSRILNTIFLLMFFSSNGHLTLIHLIVLSFSAIPVGLTGINPEIGQFIPQMFTTLLMYSLKICLPMIATEFVTSASMGIIMKAVPQLNVFVLNIQVKIVVGLILILFILPSFGVVLENMGANLIAVIQKTLPYFT